MRTLSDVERIKQIEALRRQESAVTGLPPGYIFGLELSIRNNTPYLSPGVASIRGSLVTVTKEQSVTSDFWTVARKASSSYFVYLSIAGKITVERVAPVLEPGQYYYKNPVTGSRHLGGLQTNDAGILMRVVARDPLYIGASTTFEDGYNPAQKLNATGGRYATVDGERSKLEIFPDGEHALRVRRWDSLSSSYKDVLKVLVDGQHEGDIIIGRYDSGFSGAQWDESEATLKLRGKMYQEDGEAYPTTDTVSRFFYEERPTGPYSKDDFWVNDGAIFRATITRGLGEGLETDWVWYIKPNITASMTFPNGNSFRPGIEKTILMVPRAFRNGIEITGSLPDSSFRWTRISEIPRAYPDDDTTWNVSHSSGYRTIEVIAATIFDRASYKLEISE
ncbi:MAG: hypothetical protein ACYC2S_09815 [Spirochaetales bacterium]